MPSRRHPRERLPQSFPLFGAFPRCLHRGPFRKFKNGTRRGRLHAVHCKRHANGWRKLV